MCIRAFDNVYTPVVYRRAFDTQYRMSPIASTGPKGHRRRQNIVAAWIVTIMKTLPLE